MEKKKKEKSKLNYTGEVVVSLRKGTKVIKQKTYKNEGCWPLFYGISLGLSGAYSEMELYRPKYIKLFSIGSAGTSIPLIIPSTFGSFTETSLTDIFYNSASSATYINEEDQESNTVKDSSQIIFKFLIPFSQINTGTTTSWLDTNMIALYNTLYRDDVSKPCAYIVIKDEDDSSLLGSLVPEANYASNDYNLYIQWIMKISN